MADGGQQAIPEGEPAAEASQGVVICKSVSLSFAGGKPVTIPPQFLVEDCGS